MSGGDECHCASLGPEDLNQGVFIRTLSIHSDPEIRVLSPSWI